MKKVKRHDYAARVLLLKKQGCYISNRAMNYVFRAMGYKHHIKSYTKKSIDYVS